MPNAHVSYYDNELRSLVRGHWEEHNRVQKLEMDKTLENHDINKQNVEISMKKAKTLNKCNQCNYMSSYKGNLRTHLKTHGGEKTNKCNLCDYASYQKGNLRAHLKKHSGEKSNKCNQCSFASSRTGSLRKHLKTHYAHHLRTQ